ncbi:life-span regulatory factor-domain-containing protein [Aspergillus desertorum]
MTQSHALSHHRRSSSGSSSSKSRTSKQSIYRKAASFGISKLGTGQVRQLIEPDGDWVPEMAPFLNYCGMCEKQITVPDDRLLYCSESCRRKDTKKPLSASFPSASRPLTYSPFPSRMGTPDIVAPLTPTKAPVMASQPIRIPTDMHEAKTDIDPTEWKPVIPTDDRSSSIMASDAWKYLSRFHGDESVLPMRRTKGRNTSSTSLSTLPSLSNTPSTPSSLSSIASDYVSHNYESAHRPLPLRHKPCFSGSGSVAKGVELVVPHIAVIPNSPVDTARSGSIFPAGSGLWNGKTEATPVIEVPGETEITH